MSAKFNISSASAVLKQRYSQQAINDVAFKDMTPWLMKKECPHGKPYEGKGHCWEIECVAEHVMES